MQDTQKYVVTQYQIANLLNWVQSGEIAIPEIQRPFVWKSSKVRDLLDSLYKGFPVGYVISWQNPNVRLKDGSLSVGKKILIDGQQRVTALRAAILGERVLDKNFKSKRITISFNPQTEVFEVANASTKRNNAWLTSVHEVLRGDSFDAISTYLQRNPDCNRDMVKAAIQRLFGIQAKAIGMIELAADLDIEMVTDIFIRINSKGVTLNQADFVMSKIASDTRYGGQLMRKAIDYFSNLAVNPEFAKVIEDNDPAFAKTDYYATMSWLRKEKEDLYDPSYTDVLRVAYGTEFHRAVLRTLVASLSGRDPVARIYKEEISEDAHRRLDQGVRKVFNETKFKRFVMIVKSAGFVVSGLIRSQNALNFAYYLYLTLVDRQVPAHDIERQVRRWLALSILTNRATGSFESQFDFDMRAIKERDFGDYLADIEAAELGDSFWTATLPQNLQTPSTVSPYFMCFLAAQAKTGVTGFLSRDITVRSLLEQRGDVHHVYPKAYLKRKGFSQSQYNQVANLVYMQQEVNIAVGDRAPAAYLTQVFAQASGEAVAKHYGGIDSLAALRQNLAAHAIPTTMLHGEVPYLEFLAERRALMAEVVRVWYGGL